MPLQSWSKKVRQQDFNLPWAFQIGRDPEASAAGHVKVSALESNTTIEVLNSDITATTEDVNVFFPSFSGSPSGAGQIIRGIHSFSAPNVSADSSTFNIDKSYGLRVENTGTCDITIFNCFRSFIKQYPSESIDSASTIGLGLSAQDEADYADTYTGITTIGTALNLSNDAVNMVIAEIPAPSGLVSAFNSLSSSSSNAEIQAVLDSNDFGAYYGNQLPVATAPLAVHIWQVNKTTPVSLPLVLAPGETVTIGLTKDISEYFYRPFLLTL